MQFFNAICRGTGIDVTPESKTVPVLALDGGGIRAFTTLEVLARLEKLTGKKIGELFHFTGATSVGCLMDALLKMPVAGDPSQYRYSAIDLTSIVESKMKKIFDRSFLNPIETLNGYYAPKYSSDGMNEVLDGFFQDMTAKELKGNYCYSSFQTNDFLRGYFPFTSEKARKDPLWHDLKVKDMLSGVTAAPTYFSPKKMTFGKDDKKQELNIIDGGIADNNPCTTAYIEANRLFQAKDDMLLFSVGTGSVNFHVTDTDWGAFRWAPWIVTTLMSGQSSNACYQTESALNLEGQPKKFYRVQFDLEVGKDTLDDVSDANIAYLRETAKSWIDSEKGHETLEEVARKLEKCRSAMQSQG